MTNGTSPEVTNEGAQWNKIVAKQDAWYPTCPADKHIYE